MTACRAAHVSGVAYLTVSSPRHRQARPAMFMPSAWHGDRFTRRAVITIYRYTRLCRRYSIGLIHAAGMTRAASTLTKCDFAIAIVSRAHRRGQCRMLLATMPQMFQTAVPASLNAMAISIGADHGELPLNMDSIVSDSGQYVRCRAFSCNIR